MLTFCTYPESPPRSEYAPFPARRAGADDYLVKPLDCEALLRKMRRLNASTDTGDADAGDADEGFDRT
jgi:DNA-binding response OmpR family regulator